MFSRACAAAAVALSLLSIPRGGDALPHRHTAFVAPTPPPLSNRVAFTAKLHDGRFVTVYTDGHAMLTAPQTPATGSAALKRVRAAASMAGPRAPRARQQIWVTRYGPLGGEVPASVRRQIVFDLEHPPERFAAQRVLVAFAPSVAVARDSDALAPAAVRSLQQAILARRAVTPHAFTSDVRTNAALSHLGVDRVERLFARLDRGTLGSLRARAEGRTHRALIPFENAYALHVSGAPLAEAVRKLRALPGVAYAAPDYTVQSMIADRRPIPSDALREIAAYRRSPMAFGRSVR
ncbi:MAG TPA: hypothetical protein VGX96_12580, partial [Candidatus Elarobacter sp.]|nr:hypothetical protein [Candidatus Elarobacter sp.]